MSEKNTYINIQNSYVRNNRIRTKLLLFIDNEIQSKIKQNKNNLKYSYGDAAQIIISFEETFIQNQNIKYDFSSSNILKTKKNINSDKSFSTFDDSSNKINEKSHEKERISIHSKTISKERNDSNKLLNKNISFHKKTYSIKNQIKQSRTFLILPKQKKSTEYLKNLCNSLKINKNNKKFAKHIRSISINTKLFDLNNNKKANRKSNVVKKEKKQKSKKDNLYTYSLFRKPQKINPLNHSKNRVCGKSSNSIFIAIEQN